AEDGIRDRNVTGVQTCALPIYKVVRKYVYSEVTRITSLRPYARRVFCAAGNRRMKILQRTNIVMDVHEVARIQQWILLSIQHLFAMFGCTILVPFLTGLSPAVALVLSRLGTLSSMAIIRAY